MIYKNLMVTTNQKPTKNVQRTKRKELKQNSKGKQQTTREELKRRRKAQRTTMKKT